MQWQVIEEGLNSRTWLLDDPIGAARYGADYSCSGRSTLMTSLHSHKPLDTVVLALGCNDCKAYLNLAAEQITTGAQILIHDIRRAHDCGPRAMPKQSPAIILMTPPAIQITPQSLAWGFEGADEKSIALAELYRQLAAETGSELRQTSKKPSNSLNTGLRRYSVGVVVGVNQVCGVPSRTRKRKAWLVRVRRSTISTAAKEGREDR